METRLEEINKDSMNRLIQSLETAKDVITKDYLYKLSKYEVEPIPRKLRNLEIADYVRIYKFTKLVADKNESVIDKLVTVLNAAYSSHATIVAIISGHEAYTDYYLGVVSKDVDQQEESVQTQGAILKGVLTGNFPGLKIDAVKGEEKRRLLRTSFVEDYITSISGIASIRKEKENSYEKFVQGIEHLVDSLQGREYNVVVIADPISCDELANAKQGYEALYTQLSPFLKTTISFNESETMTLTQSHTDGMTETIGESVASTQNYSETNGWNESYTHGSSENKDFGHLAGTVLGMGLGAIATVATGGAAAIATAAMLGSSLSGGVGGAIVGSSGKNYSETNGESRSRTNSSGTTNSRNSSRSIQNSDTRSEADGETYGKTLQLSNENKTVKDLLDKIDKNIERLQNCEAYGAFNCAAYVISSDPETNAIASSGYNALMKGDNSSLQASYINHWNADKREGQKVKQYLSKLSHPLFKNPMDQEVLLSPASIVNSYELAVNMGLPKKSINGLPVYEMASFGRNVFEVGYGKEREAKLHLGDVYHMGNNEDIPVNLNLKSLAMHTFITGSTGSGKSNTVYQLLRELNKQHVHFLVIEPAKGEYKHVFGNSGANVYGTNPYFTPLLKINPFRFPEGIHVLEHIDRLIEIFNVCWPMYAAMPAVLKDSVERAYINAGWNLATSRNKYSSELYPTFVDILHELTNVVAESAFSQEVKDNYIGSLATRIKSLTNGIYGSLFANDELGDQKLFDENVIIDLSRVGSVETKSMIMGILVMRLQEYRMTSGQMNADLQHVTVLEEAHNLLKRTSTEQSSESSNLLGKSVEMLSNAIAEVRTYGEGFIIADQAPGLLDMSVIRNTNTKIIMRLPDAEDRELVGKSANLSEDQIKELAKLQTGVAAVYQNNWLEPVLCQVHYEKTEGIYKKSNEISKAGRMDQKKLIEILLSRTAGEKLDMNVEQFRQDVIKTNLPAPIKMQAIELFSKKGKLSLDDICSVVYDMVSSSESEKKAEKAETIEEWKNAFLHAENSAVAEFPEKLQNEIAECILREQIARYDKPDEYLETWYKYIRGEVR